MELNEKHGYLDLNKLLVKEITDKIYDIIKNKSYTWKDSYTYIRLNKKETHKSEGAKFCLFYVNLEDSEIMYGVNIIIVNITDPDKITDENILDFVEGDKDGYSLSNPEYKDKTGIIFLYYNNLIELKDSKKLYNDLYSLIYHELRHYFDKLVDVIPTYNNTLQKHAINILIKDFLNDIDINKSVTDILELYCYLNEPSEINAYFHSLVVALLNYKKENPDCTTKDMLLYIKKSKELGAILYNTYKKRYETYEKYYKLITERAEINNSIANELYYFNHYFNCLPFNNNTIINQNNYIYEKILNFRKRPINRSVAKAIIHEFINEYYIKFVYMHIIKYIKALVKNTNKIIADLTTK